MKPALWKHLLRAVALAAAIGASAAVVVWAQTSGRTAYRNAYKAWRLDDPNLEREAATLDGLALAKRTGPAAAAAASYGNVRAAFLRNLADMQAQDVLWIRNAAPRALADLAPAATSLRMVDAATSIVNANIATFAGDADPGIQQLGKSLEKERSELAAISSAVRARQQAMAKAEQATLAVDTERSRALDQYEPLVAGFRAQAAGVGKEFEAWDTYYQQLADEATAPAVSSARPQVSPPPAAVTSAATPSTAIPSIATNAAPGVPASPPVSQSQAAPPTESARLVPPPSSASPGPPAAEPAPEPAGAPLEPLLREPTITPLPLARYIGEWVYPTVNGLFHGAEPQSVDLVVNQDNGRASGTFTARFKLPDGSSGDPVLTFSFEGPLQATRNQTFTLTTSDGTKGTIELIPANAFNLLELNIQTDPNPRKVRFADVLLVKK